MRGGLGAVAEHRGFLPCYHPGVMKWIMAIDPGASGGIARLTEDDKVDAWTMPSKGLSSIASLIHDLSAEPGCERIVLEKVWAREGDGKRAATTFMQHVGFLKGCIYSTFDRPESLLLEVEPTKWQAALGCPKTIKDRSVKAHVRKRMHKNALKDLAGMLFPDVSNITLATADALLLLEYWRRLYV